MSTNRNLGQQAYLTEQASAINDTLNATPSGSTDTAILRFNAAATVVGASLTEATTAAAGTILSVTRPGWYHVSFSTTVNGAVAIATGVGLNNTAAPIIADPVVDVGGVIASMDGLNLAASTHQMYFSEMVLVTAALAAATAFIRFMGTDSAAAAPAGLVAAQTWYRVQKIANVPF